MLVEPFPNPPEIKLSAGDVVKIRNKEYKITSVDFYLVGVETKTGKEKKWLYDDAMKFHLVVNNPKLEVK